MKELDLYWEDCIISENQKEELIIKYNLMFDDVVNTSNFLKENNYYSWSIISGYYSMFYKALIILAKNHNLKPKSFEAHRQVINAFHFFYSKKEMVKLLNKAFNKIDFNEIPGNLLYKGKDLRNKINYSTQFNSDFKKEELEEFIINIRDKFINLANIIIGEEKNDN